MIFTTNYQVTVTADTLRVKDWQVGATTHSSARDAVATPYVSLTLETGVGAGTGPTGEMEKIPLQLSYSDFQVSD